ncbi:MAG: putative glycoside hydrolase [Oscillospiraceae bacterium]|jgi:hypothetical protein|nr:putative glycoside hydrolase [Oscillospiraceae bacterium]
MAKKKIKQDPVNRIRPIESIDNPSKKGSRQDFQELVIGAKRMRKFRARRALRVALRVLAMLLVASVGFFVTETLLQVSELPPKEEETLARTEAASVSSSAQTQTQTTQPAPKPVDIRAIYAPIRMLDSRERTGRILKQIAGGTSNAAVILFKDEDGYLSYKSRLPEQKILKASRKARTNVEACLADYTAAGVPVIGIVYCFQDSLAAKAMIDGAVVQKDNPSKAWIDQNGKAWLNPFSSAAQDYLCGVIGELCQKGVTHILLAGVEFPDANPNEAFFVGEENQGDLPARNAALRSFLQKAKQAASGAQLICVMEPTAAMDGSNELGGDLWNSAADLIAIDTRGAPWAVGANWDAIQSSVLIFASADDAGEHDVYLVIERED